MKSDFVSESDEVIERIECVNCKEIIPSWFKDKHVCFWPA